MGLCYTVPARRKSNINMLCLMSFALYVWPYLWHQHEHITRLHVWSYHIRLGESEWILCVCLYSLIRRLLLFFLRFTATASVVVCVSVGARTKHIFQAELKTLSLVYLSIGNEQTLSFFWLDAYNARICFNRLYSHGNKVENILSQNDKQIEQTDEQKAPSWK